MPSVANLATSVQPSLARGVPPTAATNEAAAGCPRPGLAPAATSSTVTGHAENVDRTNSAASCSSRSGANR
jgi:hypothetical protein